MQEAMSASFTDVNKIETQNSCPLPVGQKSGVMLKKTLQLSSEILWALSRRPR